MTIELEELRWVVTVARHPSLRQAAEVLKLRQSTLSRRIRDIERRLGAKLFERNNSGTRVTAAGRDFLDASRHIVDEVEAVVARFRTRSRGEAGRLAVGVNASFSAGNLRATLLEHKSRFPEVHLYMADGSGDHLVSDLANSTIDVAFIAGGKAGWTDRSLAVWSERVVVALSDSHPLARQESVSWSDLQHEPILIPERGPGPQFYGLLVGEIGCSPPSRLLTQDVGLDRFLTMASAGCGVLLALEGATGASYPGAVFRELQTGGGPTRLQFYACWRESNSNPSLGPFLRVLSERYPELPGLLSRE